MNLRTPWWLAFVVLAGCSDDADAPPVGTPTGTTTTTTSIDGTDADGDGYPVPADCDDTDAAIHPGAEEICDNDVDEDCNPANDSCGPCVDCGTCEIGAEIPDAGCSCGEVTYTAGYCCAGGWQGFACDYQPTTCALRCRDQHRQLGLRQHLLHRGAELHHRVGPLHARDDGDLLQRVGRRQPHLR